MSVLHRKLRRDLFRQKWLIGAVVSITAVGISCFTGMLATYQNLETARVEYYARCNMADFWINLKKIPVTTAQNLLNQPGITNARLRISYPVTVDITDTDSPVSGLAISMPSKNKAVLNDIIIRKGSYFSNKKNEIIISEKFAKARSITPGDKFPIVIKGIKKEMRVVGTAISPEFIYQAPPGGLVDNPKEYGIFFVKRSFAEDNLDFKGACNNITGSLAKNFRNNVREKILLDKLDDLLSTYGVFSVTSRKNQFSNMTLMSELEGLQTMAIFIPAIFLLVSGLALNVLMTRITEQQRVTAGTLGAMGYSRMTITLHYLSFGTIVGLVGGTAGVMIGHIIAGAMTEMYKIFFVFPSLSNRLYPIISSSGLLIGILCAVLGALRGVRMVNRLEPAEAMHPPPPESGKKIFLEKFSFFEKLNFRMKLVLRNIMRNPGRTSASIIASGLGAAIMSLAFGFVDSMDAMIKFQFDKVMLSDYSITFNEPVDFTAVKEVERLPGVVLAEPLFSISGTFINGTKRKKTAVMGLPQKHQMIVPADKDGNPVRIPENGLLMAKRLADHMEMDVGDSILFEPVRGDVRKINFKLAGTVDSMIGLGVYANMTELSRKMKCRSTISGLNVRFRGNDKEKKNFLKELKRRPAVQYVGNMKAQKVEVKKQFDNAMLGMATVMILFAAVIFFGTILNGSMIALEERKRENATYWVLGYTPKEISSLYFKQNLITNIPGAILGLPLGYFFLKIMMINYANDAYSMPAVLNLQSYIYTMGLAVIFVFIAQIIIYRQIIKANWLMDIGTKE